MALSLRGALAEAAKPHLHLTYSTGYPKYGTACRVHELRQKQRRPYECGQFPFRTETALPSSKRPGQTSARGISAADLAARTEKPAFAPPAELHRPADGSAATGRNWESRDAGAGTRPRPRRGLDARLRVPARAGPPPPPLPAKHRGRASAACPACRPCRSRVDPARAAFGVRRVRCQPPEAAAFASEDKARWWQAVVLNLFGRPLYCYYVAFLPGASEEAQMAPSWPIAKFNATPASAKRETLG